MKKALITGIGGQDGAYLAYTLLLKGYLVFGTSRNFEQSNFKGLRALNIYQKVKILNINLLDFQSVVKCLSEVNPDEIYNLASQSSVGKSFQQPLETFESISNVTINILEAIKFIRKTMKFYSAGSGECFGNTGSKAANEITVFNPLSPYARAKANAFYEVVNYRKNYNLFACTGILFNHESPLRGSTFVTRKIIEVACRIAQGSSERLQLGNIKISRDWGWAPEYVESMWIMLQQSTPEDYVIATGRTSSLEYFIELTFSACGLDWKKWVDIDTNFFRPNDLIEGRADPSKAKRFLRWSSNLTLEQIINRLVAVELGKISITES